jgi:hypothetical protein
MRNNRLICAAALAALAVSGFAQQPPLAQTSLTVEGNNISVKYSAPSVKGRKIFGGVVPYNQVWRIGENAAAAFHTDADIVFKGVNVSKGDYTLYVLVAADKWQLIINKQSGPKALAYDPKMDLGRVVMSLAKPAAPVETCKLTLTKTAAMAGKLELAWENTVASVPFYLDKAPGDSEW